MLYTHGRNFPLFTAIVRNFPIFITLIILFQLAPFVSPTHIDQVHSPHSKSPYKTQMSV
jgi:hypothetical protein